MSHLHSTSWYVVCQSKELKCKPKNVTLNGIPIVLFRQNRKVVALLDKCPHRNAPLSCGKVLEKGIQCPYHGWTFNGKGECVDIPGLGDFESKPFYNVSNFKAYEAAGLIWVAENPEYETPYIPNYCNTKKFISFGFSSKSNVSLANALENFLDGTHTNYVHSGLIRKEDGRQKVTAIINTISDSIDIQYTGEEKQSGIISKWFEGRRVRSVATFTMPNIAELKYYDSKGLKAAFFVHFLPEGDCVTNAVASVWIRKTRYFDWLIKPVLFPFLWLALKQDRKILELQQMNIEKFGSKESFINTKIDIIRPYLKQLLSGQKLAKVKDKEVVLYL